MSFVPGNQPTLITADGAVAPQPGNFHITKDAVTAITLVKPSIDGQEMTFIDETGHAHTIVVGGSPANGVNDANHGTLTFNGTKGSAVKLVARNGFWFATVLTGVTLS